MTVLLYSQYLRLHFDSEEFVESDVDMNDSDDGELWERMEGLEVS